MTYGAFSPGDFAAYDTGARTDKALSLPLLCGVTLIASASVGLWMLYAPGPTTPDVVAAPAQIKGQITGNLAAETAATAPAVIAPLRRYAGFLDPAYSGGAVPGTFAQSAPLRSGFAPLNRRTGDPLATAPVELRTAEAAEDKSTGAFKTAALETAPVEIGEPQIVPPAPMVSEIQNDVPMPAPRPRFEDAAEPATAPVLAAPRHQVASQTATETPAAPAAPATPGLFDKIFGKSEPKPGPNTPPPAGTALAYAAPQESLIGNLFAGRPSATADAAPDRYTAVYDITAHTVYMPDGSQLEAHSGLGEALDNPSGVHLRMRGATPPNVYALTQREALFHGVRALRLTPIGTGETYGRAGLLAHTYMLRGRSGESNGCVVFRNYEAFLRAFDSGQIKRLVVVARRA